MTTTASTMIVITTTTNNNSNNNSSKYYTVYIVFTWLVCFMDVILNQNVVIVLESLLLHFFQTIPNAEMKDAVLQSLLSSFPANLFITCLDALMNALMKLRSDCLFCPTDTPEAPVISGLLSATEGQRVTLNCSVSCHCPSAPPTLHWILEQGWNDSEVQKIEAEMLLPDLQRPTLLSSLSFTATHQVKPRIKCEVRHPGVRALATAKNLHITCEQRLDFTDFHLLCLTHYNVFFFIVPPHTTSSFSEGRGGPSQLPDGSGGRHCLAGLHL